jgi:hypothetical protein
MKIKLILITYMIAVLKNFTVIHVGTFIMKIKSTFKLGVLLSPVLYATEKMSVVMATWLKINVWVIDNSTYIQLVLGAIAIDHVLGSIKHLFWTQDFEFRKNLTGLSIKIGLVVAVGFLFEGLNELVHEHSIIKDYLTTTTRIVVFLYPAGSAFSNSSVISGGKFPPIGWMERLKKFQTNLNPQDLTPATPAEQPQPHHPHHHDHHDHHDDHYQPPNNPQP